LVPAKRRRRPTAGKVTAGLVSAARCALGYVTRGLFAQKPEISTGHYSPYRPPDYLHLYLPLQYNKRLYLAADEQTEHGRHRAWPWSEPDDDGGGGGGGGGTGKVDECVKLCRHLVLLRDICIRNNTSRTKRRRYGDGAGNTRSTQPCIPPGSLNRVPASAGVKAGMSPLPGGR